jgi:DNA repair ATPase RecN
MPIYKPLFIEDLKGLNGELARDLAIAEVEKYLNFEFTPEEIEDLEERNEDLIEVNEKLGKRVDALEKQVKKLKDKNRQLTMENAEVSGLLDKAAIEKG